jgi:hypothetical protein
MVARRQQQVSPGAKAASALGEPEALTLLPPWPSPGPYSLRQSPAPSREHIALARDLLPGVFVPRAGLLGWSAQTR